MKMQRHEVEEWLGDFRADLTDEQVDDLHRAFEAINERYSDPDDDVRREKACAGAAQILFGDATLNEMRDEWISARWIEREKMAALTGAIIVTGRSQTEAEIVQSTGLNRMTVRKCLGK